MRAYDKHFKEEAVRLAMTSEQPISRTARDLGIKEGTLYHWIDLAKKKAKTTIADEEGNNKNLLDELNRLRKENTCLREEREILKKAANFFAKESK